MAVSDGIAIVHFRATFTGTRFDGAMRARKNNLLHANYAFRPRVAVPPTPGRRRVAVGKAVAKSTCRWHISRATTAAESH